MIYRLSKRLLLQRRPEGYYDLSITPDAEIPWTLALGLLAEGLVEELEVADGAMRLSVNASIPVGHRGRADVGTGTLRLSITPTEARLWLHYFLRAFRDGSAEVDHLDCEFRGEEGLVDLVIRVENAKPPASAAEARRRLGL
jgi:hypothetical protein